MSIFNDFLSHFPPDVEDTIRTIWDALDAEEQTRFLSLIAAFPTDTGLVKGLIKLSSAQVRQAFGSKHNVVILGPANVGKSTLYNQMVRSNQDKAAVGPLPGTTRDTRQADAGLFTVIDTPGTDLWRLLLPSRPTFWCWYTMRYRGSKRTNRNCSMN
jgi:hypothetical protein